MRHQVLTVLGYEFQEEVFRQIPGGKDLLDGILLELVFLDLANPTESHKVRTVQFLPALISPLEN